MPDFTFQMDIHQEGIILVKMTGVFEFDVWRAKRQQILDTRLSGVNLVGRPSIVDLTVSDPPPSDWKSTFLRLHEELTRVGEGTGPIAVVLGDDRLKLMIARLYTEIITLGVGETPNIIPFRTFDDAFRWVMENDSWRNDMVN